MSRPQDPTKPRPDSRIMFLPNGVLWYGDCPLCGDAITARPPQPAMLAWVDGQLVLHPGCFFILAKYLISWWSGGDKKGLDDHMRGKPPWYVTNLVNSLILAWLTDHGLIEIGQLENTFRNQPSTLITEVPKHGKADPVISIHR